MRRGQPPSRFNLAQRVVALWTLITGYVRRDADTGPVNNHKTPMRALRVLVAEDNPPSAVVIAGYLDMLGHQAAIVESGWEAVNMVAQQDFDLVLMDLQMPGMDGLEATGLIRGLQDERRAATPIFALTADVSQVAREATMAVGMNDLLHKPLSPERLQAAIQNVVLRQRNRDKGDRDKGDRAEQTLPQKAHNPTPPLAPAGPATELIDREVVARMISDLGYARVKELGDKAQTTFADMLAAVRHQLVATEPERREIANIAHKMAGTTSAAGLLLLAEAVRDLERRTLSDQSVQMIALHCNQIDDMAAHSFAAWRAFVAAQAPPGA